MIDNIIGSIDFTSKIPINIKINEELPKFKNFTSKFQDLSPIGINNLLQKKITQTPISDDELFSQIVNKNKSTNRFRDAYFISNYEVERFIKSDKDNNNFFNWKKNPIFKDPRYFDNEELNAQNQSGFRQFINGASKALPSAINAFVEGLNPIPGVKENSEFANWIKNWSNELENSHPNFYSKDERDNPLAIRNIADGNFWGDKVLKNAGFTVGAVASAIAWDAAITAITFGTGTAPATAIAFGFALNNIAKKFTIAQKIIRGIEGTSMLGKVTKGSIAAYEGFKNYSTGQKVLTFAKLGYLNYVGSNAESTIEGYEGLTNLNDQMIEKFIEKNGRTPLAHEYASIKKIATEMANTRYAINLPLLMITNAIEFGTLFSPSKLLTTGGVGFGEKIGVDAAGQLFKRGWKNFSKLEKVGRVLGSSPVKNFLAEGFQEGMQYSIEKATEDLAFKKFANPNFRVGLSEYMESQALGLQKTFSENEGLESMFIGGLTGLITSAGTSSWDKFVSKKSQKEDMILGENIEKYNELSKEGILNSDDFKEYIKLAAERDQINFDGTLTHTILDAQMQQAIKDKNAFAFKALQHDKLFNLVSLANKLGKVDAFKLKIDQLKDLSIDEFAKQMGLENLTDDQKTKLSENIDEYIDVVKNKVDQMSEIIKTVDNSLLNTFDPQKNPVEFNAFNELKNTFAFQLSNIDDIKGRMTEEMDDILSDKLNPLSQNMINGLLGEDLNEESLMLDDFTKNFVTEQGFDLNILNNKYAKAYTAQLNDIASQISLLNIQIETAKAAKLPHSGYSSKLAEKKKELTNLTSFLTEFNSKINKFGEVLSLRKDFMHQESIDAYKDLTSYVVKYEMNKDLKNPMSLSKADDLVNAIADLHLLNSSLKLFIDKNNKFQTPKGQAEYIKQYTKWKDYAQNKVQEAVRKSKYETLRRTPEESINQLASEIQTNLTQIEAIKAQIEEIDKQLLDEKTTPEEKELLEKRKEELLKEKQELLDENKELEETKEVIKGKEELTIEEQIQLLEKELSTIEDDNNPRIKEIDDEISKLEKLLKNESEEDLDSETDDKTSTEDVSPVEIPTETSEKEIIITETPSLILEAKKAPLHGKSRVLMTVGKMGSTLPKDMKFAGGMLQNFYNFMGRFETFDGNLHMHNLNSFLSRNKYKFVLMVAPDVLYTTPDEKGRSEYFTEGTQNPDNIVIVLVDETNNPVLIDGNYIASKVGKDATKDSAWLNEGKLPDDNQSLIDAIKEVREKGFADLAIESTSAGHYNFIGKKEKFEIKELNPNTSFEIFTHTELKEMGSNFRGYTLLPGKLYLKVVDGRKTVMYLDVSLSKMSNIKVKGEPISKNIFDLINHLNNNEESDVYRKSVESYLNSIFHTYHITKGGKVPAIFRVGESFYKFEVNITENNASIRIIKDGEVAYELSKEKQDELSKLQSLLKIFDINDKIFFGKEINLPTIEDGKLRFNLIPYTDFILENANPTVNYKLDFSTENPFEYTNGEIYFKLPSKVEEAFSETSTTYNQSEISNQSEIEAKKADIERRKQEELSNLAQKQLTIGFNKLTEAKTPEQAAKAIKEIEQNVSQGAKLSSQQSKQLSDAKEQLKNDGYEIIESHTYRQGENKIVQSSKEYEGEVLTEQQVKEIESSINSREKRGLEVNVEDLPYPVTRTVKPQLNKDGKMIQAAEVNTIVFDSVEQAKNAIRKSKEAGYKQSKASDKINAKYDAEYIDKVKKGEFTKQQAKDALKEINRLTPELEKQIDDAELADLEESEGSALKDVVPVFHHTKVDVKDFDFGNFQRGKNQVSQFGDGLAVSTDTTPFLQKRYGNPIKGEVKDSDFVVIDTNKTEKEIYEELKSKGYKFNKPDGGSYIGNDPAKEYDGTEKANEQPAIISLFNDFQKSNPEVKGVKIVNHIIANEKVSPFYVIYDNKSFYGEGSLKESEEESSSALKDVEGKKADIERRRQEELNKAEEQRKPKIDELKKKAEEDIKRTGYVQKVTRDRLDSQEGLLFLDKDKINAKYDAEYLDAVKKGEMTKEQAMKALEEVGRKDSKAYAELAALEETSGVSGSALKDVESTAKALESVVPNNESFAFAISTLPIEGTINYKDIKQSDFALPFERYVNSPEKIDKEIKSAYRIYEFLKEGGKLPNNVILLDKEGKILDGNNRVKAQLALGITDFKYAVANNTIFTQTNYKTISEAYHKAKADGSNPELVKAVEDLLGKAPTQYTEAAGGSALKDVEDKKAGIEKRRQEELIDIAEKINTQTLDGQNPKGYNNFNFQTLLPSEKLFLVKKLVSFNNQKIKTIIKQGVYNIATGNGNFESALTFAGFDAQSKEFDNLITPLKFSIGIGVGINSQQFIGKKSEYLKSKEFKDALKILSILKELNYNVDNIISTVGSVYDAELTALEQQELTIDEKTLEGFVIEQKQPIEVKVKKDDKSYWTLIQNPDGTIINKNNGEKITDKNLINKAHLKSGFVKYEKITANNKKEYALTEDGRVISLNKTSVGQELDTENSSIAKDVISKGTKFIKPNIVVEQSSKPLEQSNDLSELTKEVVEPKVKTIKKFNKNNNKESLFSSKKLPIIQSLNVTNTDIEKVKAIFKGNVNIENLFQIANSDAWATFQQSAITLYKGATRADLYHEAWHHFSQLYLTKDEKIKLYEETRNKVKDLKDKSDLEIEEYIAREFAKFTETGKIEGKFSERKSIFQKIMDFLKSIFSNETNLSLDNLFNNLYKGQINHLAYNTENIMFGKLNSSINDNFNYNDAKLVESGLNSLFVQMLKEYKASISELSKIKNINRVYDEIYDYLIDEYEQSKDPVIFSNLEKLLENWNDVKRFHFENSIIFNKDKNLYTVNEEGQIVSTDENEDEKKGRNKADYQEASERSVFDILPSEIKNLIYTLVDKDKNGNEIIDPIFGLPKLVDYQRYVQVISQKLSDQTDFSDVEKVLTELAATYPPMKDLLELLTLNDSNEVKQLRVKFINSMALAKVKLYTILYNEENKDYQAQDVYSNTRRQAESNAISYFNVSPETRFIKKVNGENQITQIGNVDYNEDNVALLKDLGMDMSFTDYMSTEQLSSFLKNLQIPFLVNHLRGYLKQHGVIKDVFKALNTKIDGQSRDSVFKRIVKADLEVNPAYISATSLNAENKLESENVLWSTITKDIKSIQKAKSISELIQNPNRSHFNFSAVDMDSSVLLNLMFDKNGNRTNFEININNYNGINNTKQGETGVKTKDVYYIEKAIMDISQFINNNILTTMQLSNKATYLGFKLSNKLFNDKYDFEEKMLKYLFTELDIIEKFHNGDTELTKLEKLSKAIGTKNNYNFAIFKDIITNDTQEIINEYLETGNLSGKTKTNVLEQINSFFNDEKKLHADFLGESLSEIVPSSGSKYPKDALKETLLDDYIKNQFIFNVELSKITFGNPYMHKDPYKRIAGATSTGNRLLVDDLTLQDFESSTKETQRSSVMPLLLDRLKLKEYNLKNQRSSNKELRFITFKDREMLSKYYDDLLDAVNSELSKHKENSPEYKALLEKKKSIQKAYSKVNGSNAMGAVTMDAWRKFNWLAGRWTPELEKIYEKTIKWDYHNRLLKQTTNEEEKVKQLALRNENTIDEAEKLAISVMKYQYYGNVKNTTIMEKAFHKYQLMPLIPQLIEGKLYEHHLDRMIMEDVDYLLFDSADKLEKTKAPNNFYNNKEQDNVFVLEDFVNTYRQGDTSYDVRTGFIENLKEQVFMENGTDNSLLFGTQIRALLFNTDSFSDLYDEFRDVINQLTQIEKDKLYEKASLNSNGEVIDKNKFVQFLLDELDKKVVNYNVKDYLRLTKAGEFAGSLDTNLQRTPIESIINSVIQNKIVKQKMHGEMMVQVSNVGFETFGKKDSLKFYGYEQDGKVRKMEVKIPLSGKFKNLLNLVIDGKKVETRERLNQLIKEGKIDQRSLTMVGYRIPTQEHNSVEVMIVQEFLDPISNLIVVPYEITAKAGSDFDIDKLNIFKPHIDENGNYITSVEKPTDLDYTNLSEIKEKINSKKETVQKSWEIQSKKLQKLYDERLANKEEVSNNIEDLRYSLRETNIEIAFLKEDILILKELNQDDKSISNLLITMFSDDAIKNRSLEELIKEKEDKILQYNNDNKLRDELIKTFKGLSSKSPEEIARVEKRKQAQEKYLSELNDLFIELNNISYKIKNYKASKQNRIIEIFEKVLLDPNNFINLITPNSTSLFDEAINNVFKIKYSETERQEKKEVIMPNDIVHTNSLLPRNSWDMHRVFGDSGKGLGIAAVGNKFSQLIQKAKVNFTEEYLEKYNLRFKIDNLSNRNFQNRESKATAFSQLINLLVDVANDPRVGYVNMGDNVIPIVNLMINFGIDIEQIIYLINQPIVVDYVDYVSKNSKRLIKSKNDKTSFSSYLATKVFNFRSPLSTISKEYEIDKDSSATEIAEKLIDVSLENNKENIGFKIAQLNAEKQLLLLSQFAQFEEMSKDFLELQMTMNFDTNTVQDGFEAFQKEELFKEIKGRNTFTNLDDLKYKTVISPLNVLQEIVNINAQLLPLANSKLIYNFLTSKLSNDFKFKKNKHKAKFIRTFKNDFIMYLFQNFLGRSEKALLNFNTTFAPVLKTNVNKLLRKQNLFTVKPIQTVDKKAIIKASIANKYIGFGEGIVNSSTELYRKQAGEYANVGNYNDNDIVFVSVPGKRGTEQQQKEQQDKTIKEALKAIEIGAILITDNKAYVDSNSYNTGEKRLAKNLETKGYIYSEQTIDGQLLGIWSKNKLNQEEQDFTNKPNEFGIHLIKNLYKEFAEIKNNPKYKDLFNQYLLLDRLFVTSEEEFKNIGLSYYNKDSELQNTYIEQFKELLNNPDLEIRNFMLKFAYMGFYQSGLNKSLMSSTDILPIKLLSPILENIREQYLSEINDDRKLLSTLYDFHKLMYDNNEFMRSNKVMKNSEGNSTFVDNGKPRRYNSSLNNRVKVDSKRFKDYTSNIDKVLEDNTPTQQTTEQPINKEIKPNEVKGIEINSYQTGLGNSLTNVHYATNGKSAFDIIPSDKSLTLTKEAKNKWGESVEAWYKSNNAQTKGIPEGVEGDKYDMDLMVGLITDKLKQYPNLVEQINQNGGLSFLQKSTHNMGNGRWSSKNPKNMFMNSLIQAYKNTTQVVDKNQLQKQNIIPLTSNFTRESVKNDIDYIYLFTDNAKRTSGKNSIEPSSWYRQKYTTSYPLNFPSMTQAVARGLNNAFPITTMVDDNRTQWKDSQFDEYKKIIDDEINTIKEVQAKFKGIKFAAQNPFGQGKISNMKQSAPKIWNYLNEKLAEIGIDNSGETPKVKNISQVVDSGINFTQEQQEFAKKNSIEQNFFDGKAYHKGKDSNGKDIWGYYKIKNGIKSSIEGALKGFRTQTTRSVSQIEQLKSVTKNQGITNGIVGTIVWMEDKGEKSPTKGQGGWFRITSEPYTPNKTDFNNYENWESNVWEDRNSEFKIGTKDEWKSIRFEKVDSGIDTSRKIEIPYFRTNRKKGDVEILPNSEGYFAESQFGKGYYISLDKPYIDHSYFEGKVLKQGLLSINPNEVIDLSELIIPTSDKKEKDIKDIFENGDRNIPLDKRFLDKGYKAVIRVVDGRALEMIIYDLNLANKLIKEQQEFKGDIEDFYKGGKYYNPNYSKNKLPEGIEKLQENFIKEYGKEAFQEFLDNYKSFDDNLTLIHKDIFGIRQELKPNVDNNKEITKEDTDKLPPCTGQ